MVKSKLTIVGINYAPEPTGIAVYTTGLAEALAAERDIAVVTGVPHYPQWRVYDGYNRFRSRVDRNGVRVNRVRHRVPSQPRILNRVLMELQFGFRAVFSSWNRADVVLLVSPALLSSGIGALRAKLTATPTCIWVQDIYSLGVTETGTAGVIAGRAIRAAERRILGSGAAVVVIHERFKRYLVEELGLDADRVHVVRNWAHVSAAPVEMRDEVRASMGWAPDDVVVLHAGNMGAKQGLENVVAASRLADERGSRVRFVLMGDGNQRASLEGLGGNDRLQIIDPVDDDLFMPVLDAADVLLVNERPGLTEMCVPSKLTSYYSTGRPVLAATDAASVTAEELQLSGGGVRVDAANPSALLSAAEELHRDPAIAEQLGRSGKLFRADHLTQQSAVAAFERIIDRVVPRAMVPMDDAATHEERSHTIA